MIDHSLECRKKLHYFFGPHFGESEIVGCKNVRSLQRKWASVWIRRRNPVRARLFLSTYTEPIVRSQKLAPTTTISRVKNMAKAERALEMLFSGCDICPSVCSSGEWRECTYALQFRTRNRKWRAMNEKRALFLLALKSLSCD